MLHLNKIRDNKELYISLLKVKNIDVTPLFDSVIALDDKRKLTQQKADTLLAKGNKLASQIGELYKKGDKQAANTLKDESLVIKEESKVLQKHWFFKKIKRIKR